MPCDRARLTAAELQCDVRHRHHCTLRRTIVVLGEVGDADAPERRRATQVVGRDRRERKIGQPLLMEGAQSAGLRCEGVCPEKA